MILMGFVFFMRYFCIKRMINVLKFIDIFDVFFVKGFVFNKFSYYFFLGVFSEMGDLMSN